MLKKMIAALALSCLLMGATKAEASYAIEGFTPTQVGRSSDNFTLGYSFTLNTTVFVNQLSIYDATGNALVNSHDIGIFDASGSALVVGTVNSLSSRVTTPGPNPQVFAVQSVAQTILGPGTYFIGATYVGNDADALALTTSTVAFDTITYTGAKYGRGVNLTAPTSGVSSPQGFIGPNFQFFLTSQTVPEPSSIILTSLGAVGLMVGRLVRRKKIAA